MARKIPGGAIQANTITVTQLQTTVVTQIQAGASGGPKISAITYPNSATAAANTGSETITLTGTGFESGVTVIVNGNVVPSVTRTNANSVSFTTPTLSSTTYPIYVVNPDGGTAIFINPGLQVSGKPNWITTSPLLSWGKLSALSRTLEANSDSAVTYSLAGGSSLPAGLTLSSNGLLSGTLTSPPASTTTYNFTVIATDAEGQTTSSAFSINASAAITATGGTVTNVGSYRIHTFTSSGTFEVAEGGDVEYLVVAGGGGGGAVHGGGGGAGGFRTGSGFSISSGSYPITVGAGGTGGGTNSRSPGGSNSTFSTITSIGGGGGGTYATSPSSPLTTGGTGGSGGGGGSGEGGSGSGGSGTPGQGNNGGNALAPGSGAICGGGGGAGSAGSNANIPGNGGNGSASSISGSSVTYGGGGGGGGDSRISPAGSGGSGGGGAGSTNGSPVAGTTNTGGGGGGAGYSNQTNGAAGGSGIVIIRYLV
jgi:hypothetical protein